MTRSLAARVRLARLLAAPPSHWYLAIALTWGVLQVFAVPPLQVPDEGDHFFRAWSVASGQLFADQNAEITLPGRLQSAADLYLGIIGGGSGLEPLPVSLEGRAGFTGYEDLFDGGGPSTDIRIPSRVANYGPIGYLPQAAGIGLGRLLGAGPLASLYLARLANLLVSTAMIFLAIRLAPYGKEAFFFVALLPMTMFMLASASCDALTIAGAMLFTALALRASVAERLRWPNAALIVASGAVLLNVKPGYWALTLLTVPIPAVAVGSRRRKWALVALTAAASVLAFALIYELSVGSRTGASGSAHSQLSYLMGNPLVLFSIVGATLKDQWLVVLLETIGVLGWLTVWLLPPAYLAALLAVPPQVFRAAADPAPSGRERLWLVLTALAVFLTMTVALYAFLSPPGATMFGTQGRYFEPVLLLLLLAITGVRVTPRPRAREVTIVVAITLMVFNFAALLTAYGI